MKKRTFYAIFILFFSVIFFTPAIFAQTVVGTLPFPSSPKSVAVYETGNKVFISTNGGNLYIYDGTTLEELDVLTLDYGATSMVVHEPSGKLFAAIPVEYKVAVINAATGEFLHYLSGYYPNRPTLLIDEGLGKLYIMPSVFNTYGLYQVDIATETETYIPGFSSGAYESVALNPVTHELFLPYPFADEMSVVDGITLGTSVVDGLGAIDSGVNWTENKVCTIYPMRVYDRDTGTITPLAAGNDACTSIIYNPTNNRMYTSSEVNGISTIIEGDTDEFFNLPMFMSTPILAVRYATNHVYYVCNGKCIAVLDDSTRLLNLLSITPAINGDIAINQTTGRVFILGSDFVIVIQDTDTLTNPPVYLGNYNGYGSGSVFVLDTVRKEIVDEWETTDGGLPWGSDFHAMVVSPGGGRLYVPFQVEGGIFTFAGCDKNAMINKFESGIDPAEPIVPAITPDGSHVYLTNSASNNVSVIDMANYTEITRIAVGNNPWGAAVTPDGLKVYITNKDDNTVSVINTTSNTVINTIGVNNEPLGIAINPSGSKAYVANKGNHTVSVINISSDTVIKTVPVGLNPQWLVFNKDGKYVYVSNLGSDCVSIIDAGNDTVIHTASVDSDPKGMCALPDGSEIYVATGETISIINTTDFSVTSFTPEYNSPLTDENVVSVAVADQSSCFAGRVMNSDGIPVNGALVRALQSGIEKGTATTNIAGDYAIFNLKPGIYDIEVSALGHFPQIVIDQNVEIGRIKILHFVLIIIKPEINIKQGLTNIPDGGIYDFGIHEPLSVTDVTFTIENSGTENLILGGTPIITIVGANADQFSVQQQPFSPVTPSGNTTFIIRFSPTIEGAKTASISITNNDLDENPYDITLNGNCFCTAPTITTHPQSQTIDYNSSAMLNVIATGTAPLSYQWYQGISGDKSSAPVGTNSNSYMTPALTENTNYWVKVDNPCGLPANSDTATITVSPFGEMTGPGNQCKAVQQTTDGGYVLTGASDTMTNGAFDFIVLKLYSNGSEEWRKNFGGLYDDMAFSLHQTIDDCYVVAGWSKSFVNGTPGIDKDFFVVKIDSLGNELMSGHFGGSNPDLCYSIRQTLDGGYVVAGTTESFTNGGKDILVYKLKANGKLQWKKHLGGSKDEEACCVRQTLDGNYIIGGSSKSFNKEDSDFILYKINLNGNEIWQKNFGSIGHEVLTSAEQTSDGGYVLLGYTDFDTEGGLDFLVYALDENGNKIAHKNFGGANNDLGFSVQQTLDGGYILAGTSDSFSNGGYDFLLYKLNVKGTLQWKKNFGGAEDDYAFSVIQTADSGYVVVGTTNSFVHTPGKTDILIYKLDTNGNEEWHYNFGD